MKIIILYNKAKGSPDLETESWVQCDEENPYAASVCVCVFVYDDRGRLLHFCCYTSSVEFQLNEFICLTNVTKAWKFSARWLVPVKVLHW